MYIFVSGAIAFIFVAAASIMVSESLPPVWCPHRLSWDSTVQPLSLSFGRRRKGSGCTLHLRISRQSKRSTEPAGPSAATASGWNWLRGSISFM